MYNLSIQTSPIRYDTPNFLKQWYWVKKGNRNFRKGILMAAMRENGVVHIGWSMCKWTDIPVYSRNFAEDVAVDRIFSDHSKPVPRSMNRLLDEFKVRCMKYFKTDNISVVVSPN